MVRPDEQVAGRAVRPDAALARTPKRLGGGKGYSRRTVRRALAKRGIRPAIPRRADEPRPRRFERAAYRDRNRVERLINRLKQKRAIATRYAKLATPYLAMAHLASILIWL